MAVKTIKKRSQKRNGTRGRHAWGVGPIYSGFTVYGMMAAGVLPKSKKTLEKAFFSGHATSENGVPKMVRPCRLSYETAHEIASNPEKYRKPLTLIDLIEHIIG